jgi:hypothetical protein
MLLSHQKKFLFIHIAKTGGTSVRAALQKHRWRDPYYAPIWIASKLSHIARNEVAIKLPRHAKAIAALEMLPNDFYDSLFKFAFVRNPWDLHVSCFHHIRRERPYLLPDSADFSWFLHWSLDPERNHNYFIDSINTPQTDYLVDLKGNLIVDFIGHYETLQQDFDECCKRIGVPKTTLPHRRKANDRLAYRDYYTAETQALVSEAFARDIEILGYEF